MPWRIVVDSDAHEVFRYPTTFPEQFLEQYPLDTYTHLYVENLVDPDSVKPAKAEDGSVSLTPNLDWHWTSLRTQRNALLQQSDWTQFSDSPLSPESKSSWAQYRQALRNLPETVTDPLEVTWPASP